VRAVLLFEPGNQLVGFAAQLAVFLDNFTEWLFHAEMVFAGFKITISVELAKSPEGVVGGAVNGAC